MEFNLSLTQLLMIWCLAGLACLIPLFRICKRQKYVVVPLIFAAIYLSFVLNFDFIGSPYHQKPPKFMYKHHSVDVIDNQKYITLWAIVKDADKLYRFPHTKQAEEELRRAQERGKQGTPQVGEFKNEPGKPGDTRGGKLKMYDFPYQRQIPKLTK